MEGKHVYGGSNFKGSHGAYFGKFTVSMLGEKGNLFMAWWACVMITVMLCKLECLLELFKITFAFSCRCTNPPTATASMSLFCLEMCLLPSWRTCHTGGLWWGLKRKKKHKYCTDWSPALVTAACQAYSERYNKSASSVYSTITLDHLQIYTTTQSCRALLSANCM